jgi:hypothetical protein
MIPRLWPKTKLVLSSNFRPKIDRTPRHTSEKKKKIKIDIRVLFITLLYYWADESILICHLINIY